MMNELTKKRVKVVKKTNISNNVRLRLAVFRSSKHIYAQIIDDNAMKTVVAVSDTVIKDAKNKVDRAYAVGVLLAEKAIANKIKLVYFDRSGKIYHGRVKAVAEGARSKGLEF